MNGTLVLSRAGIEQNMPVRSGNYAADLQIEDEPDSPSIGGDIRLTLFKALQDWSKLAFSHRDLYSPQLWHSATKDLASATMGQFDESVDAIRPLMYFLGLADAARDEDWDVFRAAAQEGAKPLLVISELLKSTKEYPEIYKLPTGEITLDYQLDTGRVSCVLNNKYCHIMDFKNNEMHDQVFGGDNYAIRDVREYFLGLLQNLR